MDENVSKAVGLAKSVLIQTGDSGRYPNGEGWGHVSSIYVMQIPTEAWQTIRARLVELEAQNARLRKDADDDRKGYGKLLSAFHKSKTRLATANALLRDMRDGAFNTGGWADAIDEYFDGERT